MVSFRKVVALATLALLGFSATAAQAQTEYIYGFSGGTPNYLEVTLDDNSVWTFSTTDSLLYPNDRNANQGWWSGSSSFPNSLANTNYFTGYFSGTDGTLNNFFTFDLSNLSGNVVSATLSVLPYEVLSDLSDGVDYYMFDVSTDAMTLNFTQDYNAAIHADLGSGKNYGMRRFLVSESYGGYITLSLNGDAVSDINAAAGGWFSIGGTIQPTDEPVVPEPGTVALLAGLGVGGTLLALRRRK